MRKIKLSDEQKEIISFDKGALLVKASAGSGKTLVLTERICNLAKQTKRKVLAITFTNQASEEIRKRLTEIDESLLERVFVGTFHSFCNYVLEHHGSALGYSVLPKIFSDNDDRESLVERAIEETPILKQLYLNKNDKERKKFKYRALEAISKIKRWAILDDELENEVKDNNIILLYYNYRDIMSSLNAIDYDDLLFLTYKLFISNNAIASLYRRTFEYVCIDEAQDMNKVQYMVLRSLTDDLNNNVMLVGDPNQSIYGFNDANSRFMEKAFINDYHPTIIKLKENYRSTKAILSYANQIIPNSSSLDNIVLEGVCMEENYPSVTLEAEGVISRIKELINQRNVEEIEGELSYENFAILARNKYILYPIEELLKKEEIPYYYKSSSNSVDFNSNSGKIFSLALQIRLNPKDYYHLSQLKSMLSLNNNNVNSLEEILQLMTTKSLNYQIINTVVNLNEDGKDFKLQIEKILSSIEADSSVNIGENYEKEELYNTYADFKELLTHWYNYAKKTTNKSLNSFRNAFVLGQTAINQEEKGVALSTVHTMKGQEKDIVFLIGMDDMTFPDYRAIEKGGAELEQEKNNLYVAITRARRYLYISYPECREMPWGREVKRERSRLLPSNKD